MSGICPSSMKTDYRIPRYSKISVLIKALQEVHRDHGDIGYIVDGVSWGAIEVQECEDGRKIVEIE